MAEANEEKLMRALESNWKHARHVEVLRLQFAGVFIATVFGGAIAAFSNVGNIVSVVTAGALTVTTGLALGMTHKWNMEFANQIRKADACARALKISGENAPLRDMHEMMGFPIRGQRLKWLSVRLMFYAFYWIFLVTWVSLFFYFLHKLASA